MKARLLLVFFAAAVFWLGARKWVRPKTNSEAPPQSNQPATETNAPIDSRAVRRENLAAHAATNVDREPEHAVTRVEDFRNCGRATSAAAFQTLVWAAMTGNDDELAATVAFGDGAREEAEAWRSALPAELQQKYHVVEKLPALFLAEEIVRKAAAAEILDAAEVAPNRVQLRVRTTSRDGTGGVSIFPMQRSEGGWRVEIPADMVSQMRRGAVRRHVKHG